MYLPSPWDRAEVEPRTRGLPGSLANHPAIRADAVALNMPINI